MNRQDPRKIIITAAVNGPFTMRERVPGIPLDGNPNVPYTPEEIATQNKECYDEGAAIAHTHTRNPETGANCHESELFGQAYRLIHSQTPMLCNPTTGGGGMITPEERIAIIPELAKMPAGSKPELAELTAGSMNLDLYDPDTKEWALGRLIFSNSHADFEMFLDICNQHGVKPVICCFEYSHLYNVLRMVDKGLVREPVFFDFAFGGGNIVGGLPPTYDNLKGFLDRIPDDLDHIWEVLTFGVDEFPMCLYGAALGGNIRLGLEDYPYAEQGCPTTADLIRRFVPLAEALGRKPATPDETREFLGLH
ncbi:MAG: 3-keto-5-aminohexanoate cleavage protein [Acidimicrobiia bacterium]